MMRHLIVPTNIHIYLEAGFYNFHVAFPYYIYSAELHELQLFYNESLGINFKSQQLDSFIQLDIEFEC